MVSGMKKVDHLIITPKTVTAYCADFVSTEHIDHFGLAILKTALKCALRANTVNVDEETITVVQKYVDNLKKELLKQLKS